jgi:hypothetical protein
VKPYKASNKKPIILDNPERSDDGEDNGEDGGEVWEVQEIRDHRFSKGSLQFLIQWVGSEENTWEDEGSMSCAAKVEDYFLRRCTHA